MVLPVRNAGAFLTEAVDSMLSQTFADLEILAIDDGSTDGSRAWLDRRSTKDHRLRVLSNSGRGLASALNFGILRSRSPFIARMDADDVAHPERLQRQVAFLRANPGIVLVGAQARAIDAQGRSLGKPTNFPCAPVAVHCALRTRGCVLQHSTVLARREALLAVGLYRPALRDAEDFDLWLRLSDTYALANLPDQLLDYRHHAGQISHVRNLQQKFSHGVALISARRRASDDPDPIDDMKPGLALAEWAEHFETRDPEIAGLARAVETLRRMSEDGLSPDSGDLLCLLHSVATGLTWSSRDFRVRSLTEVALQAARLRHWSIALRAAAVAVRLSPKRAIVGLARRERYRNPLLFSALPQ